ncbi:MAG: hypothetical protein WC829_02780 [Hyphomicrobium sp.]|jgi:hypothetical protein
MSRFNYQNQHKKAFVELALQCEKVFRDYAATLTDDEAKKARAVAEKIDRRDLCTLFDFKAIIEEAFRNDDCARSAAASQEITVCSACHQASCWQGIFMCQDAVGAGTEKKTRAELAALNLEHPSYWKTDDELR